MRLYYARIEGLGVEKGEVNTLALEWIGSSWSSLTACH
jgi:hypothetical protein